MKTTRPERIWTRLFGWAGILMFFAATFESFVTLFWLDREVVKMDSFRIIFALVGFVFALANRQLGVFANAVGSTLLNKFKNK